MKLTHLMAVGLTTILLSGCASLTGRDQLSTEATGSVVVVDPNDYQKGITGKALQIYDRKPINQIVKDYPYPKTVCFYEFINNTPASTPGLKKGVIEILQDNGWTVTGKCTEEENAENIKLKDPKTANAAIDLDVDQFGLNQLDHNDFIQDFHDTAYNQVWGLSSSGYSGDYNNHDERKENHDAFTEEFNKLVGQQACYSLIISSSFDLLKKDSTNPKRFATEEFLHGQPPSIRICRTNLSFQEAKPILIKKWLQLFELYMTEGIKKQWVNNDGYFVKPFDQVIKEAGID